MDATTRWETEAMRTSGARRPKPSSKKVADRSAGEWVTLREAERETGVAVNTIRRWVKRAGLPSYLESDGDTVLRMVDLEAVRARAAELGRESAAESPAKPPAEREPDPPSEEETVSAPSPVPDEAMLVPIDAWNKMINQLGNLHEAGQQLAEARERAAKAETEAMFLKERLAELRTARDEAEELTEAEPSGWRARRRARRASR